MKKYFTTTILSFIFLFSVTSDLLAATTDTSGWIWGGTDDGAGTPTGVGWISANNSNTGAFVTYALNIPQTDGSLSGYAWSENLGWISFNPGDLIGCPDGNCISARSSDTLVGWARILSIRDALLTGNSGGYQGWIHLNGVGYGIKINSDSTITKGATTSYAWSDEFGWLDFSKLIPPCTPACQDPDTVCAGDTITDSNSCGVCPIGAMPDQCVCPTVPSYICQSNDCGDYPSYGSYAMCGTSIDCSTKICGTAKCLDGCDNANWKEIAP
jgi:hypothetical protein